MGGESLQSAQFSHHGVLGDRSYAVHDGTTIRGAKKFASLMTCSAAFDEEPDGLSIPPVTITLGETTISSADPAINDKLSEFLGQSVRLDKLPDASDREYFLRPDEKMGIDEIRSVLGLEADEPFPDFSEFPDELDQYVSPPGTYFDAYPLLILTTTSLANLQEAAPDSIIDARRFRPNIVLDSDDSAAYPEEEWKHKILQIGEVVIQLSLPCPRCVMTTIGFDNLPKDPGIMRTLVKENHHKLGIYGEVIKPGRIHIDDEATILDSYDP